MTLKPGQLLVVVNACDDVVRGQLCRVEEVTHPRGEPDRIYLFNHGNKVYYPDTFRLADARECLRDALVSCVEPGDWHGDVPVSFARFVAALHRNLDGDE